MKHRTFVPHKLDMAAFIESGEALAGVLSVPDLPRLAAGLAPDVDLQTLAPVAWKAQGRTVPQRAGAPHLWLDLSARAELAWECQRCLNAVEGAVQCERSIQFVHDENTAAELDADSDDDVLALSRHFDLVSLIEDELIMAQPLVPRHERCPGDVEAMMRDDTEAAVSTDSSAAATALNTQLPSGRPNPFAVLAALKKGRS